MVAPYNPPVRGEDFVMRIALIDPSGTFKASPTLAAGDFKISKDGGALANLTTLPTNNPSGSIWITISLSAAEMTADNVAIQAIDQTSTKEWLDWAMCILTTVA